MLRCRTQHTRMQKDHPGQTPPGQLPPTPRSDAPGLFFLPPRSNVLAEMPYALKSPLGQMPTPGQTLPNPITIVQ